MFAKVQMQMYIEDMLPPPPYHPNLFLNKNNQDPPGYIVVLMFEQRELPKLNPLLLQLLTKLISPTSPTTSPSCCSGCVLP